MPAKTLCVGRTRDICDAELVPLLVEEGPGESFEREVDFLDQLASCQVRVADQASGQCSQNARAGASPKDISAAAEVGDL